MKLMYSRPILRDLSQGSRIAFVRQFRAKTQDEIAGLLGATGECRRRTMTRYEKGDRSPTVARTKFIADVNLNLKCNTFQFEKRHVNL